MGGILIAPLYSSDDTPTDQLYKLNMGGPLLVAPLYGSDESKAKKRDDAILLMASNPKLPVSR